ncbi:uncharacterized protein MELLADRAFT_89244 [Melampsora larici-populina 98AG31]|uniref:Uncharacterized protein n=1 Tax=Melampsora larici-populina (strain 98AG31 / pathotype 3-4-7) TaxID=747676 RepID=F4R5H1_MELLP|nr:uncharacterized protein MELLADRAFT_89244 [Melampsora larici-populina 98AG31]EGG12045.1 hypothetical protein MELLADRAFT_89244 [Melampsora larici-populina 98AG31]
MADPTESTTHGLYLTGNFEVEKKTSPENGWRSEYQTYSVLIGAGGAHRTRPMTYEIQAKGFSNAQFRLESNTIYFLRGSFFPSNTDKTTDDMLFFEASDRILVRPVDTFAGDTVDSIGVTGVGIVLATNQIPKPRTTNLLPNPADGEKIVTVVTVLHSDYHPTSKIAKQFKVQYRIPPTRNLAGTPKILRVGREYQFHGFLKDFDEASKVSPTNGNKEYEVGTKSDSDNSEDIKPKVSTKRPAKFVPAPLNGTSKSPVMFTNPVSTPSLELNSTEPGPSSLSSASSRPTPGSSRDSSETAISDPAPSLLGKKRSRAQPKRVGKKGKTLDLTEQI